LDLEVAYDFLAEVDFIRAKAIFSGTIGALQPRVDNRAQMDFRSALHPLLYLSHRKQGKGVVPLHIPLDDAGRILVVSGPNAGGKSVCLKTAGLLQYMLQCGMPIPVDQGSRGGIFSGIFIDIGDEQSIENDLSTYSSHLRNMKYFLEACNASTLFLIDEFGSGTEPRIGGALAEALLEGFHACGSFGIVTTHYQNLKHLAQRTPGLTNAAMLYDSRRMQPLFQLTVGNPGSSFAMEIARQTGLPEAILASATEKAGVDYVNSDNYLGEILDKKRDLEAKERKLREGDEELNRLLAQSRENLEAMRCERRETLRRAGEEAARILSEANAQIEKTIREIKEAKAEKEPTQKARKALESLRSRTLARVEPLSRQGLPPQAPPQGPILAGDRVRLKGQTAVGRVIKVNDRLATIAFGTLKSVLEVGRLEKAPAPASGAGQGREIPRNWANTEGIREKILRFKPELDVRGMRSDEALQAVSYYIDDACLAGISPVRILHGTGGGVLREIIRAYLRGVDGIARFHDEHVQSGGAGITVVELQKNL
ncbi:MAG: Smr/MutS family protein, partial [Tannerellaceae bacterium]|jgi:DNA mismatch repair protein MutS2|nr:Smr/MutS family protein [Tannerellaceae bacterium]